jgi:hypothetical protein
MKTWKSGPFAPTARRLWKLQRASRRAAKVPEWRGEFSRRRKYFFGQIVKVSVGNRYGITPGIYTAKQNDPKTDPRHALHIKGESKGWSFIASLPWK